MNLHTPSLRRRYAGLMAAALALLLAGCGPDSATTPNTTPNATFTVDVSVGNLKGTGLVLQNNGRDDHAVSANGSFSFTTRLVPGDAYNVTVKTQPSGPQQSCAVGNGQGTMASSAVSVSVTCIDLTLPLAGSVSGLKGVGLVLQNQGGDDLAVSGNGNVIFGVRLNYGDAYAITVKTQPGNPAQLCSVAGGNGTLSSSAPVFSVSCADTAVDNRPLQVSLAPLPSAAMGVLAPYVLTETQGIPLSHVDWTFDGVPAAAGSTRINNNVALALQVWNTPGTHTLSALATASSGRTATVSLTVLAVSQPLAGGVFHSCALTANRAAKCWGDGNSGELGNNSTLGATVPVDVSGLSGLLGLAAGDGHSCALKADRTVACWGDNTEGQLGNASTFHGSANAVQKPVDGLGNVVALAAGRYHTCALKTDGTVACFGQNTEKELGTGTTLSQSAAAVTVAGLSNVVAITSGGGYFTCALKADTTVACWGYNASGQLGNNQPAVAQTGTPQTVKTEQGVTLDKVLVLRSGNAHSCAVVDDGNYSVYCWGNNASNQVSSVAGHHYGAVKVPALSNVMMLMASASGSCVLDLNFAFSCWGMNALGESGGNGPTQALAQPTLLLGLQGDNSPDYAAGGNEFVCALKGDGSAACVGRGGNGQLGNGAALDASSLRSVSAPAGTFWHWMGAAP